MKLTKILHPELIYGLRGNADEIKILHRLMDGVTFSKEGYTYLNLRPEDGATYDPVPGSVADIRYTGKPIPGKKDIPGGQWVQNNFSFSGPIMQLDDHSRNFMAMCKKFKVESGKSYYINKDFLLALSEIDREIPLEYLPKRFLGYFGFPDKAIQDDTGYVTGAYVYVGDARETILKDDLYGKQVLWVVYLNEDESGQFSHTHITEFRLELDSKKISEITSDLPSSDFFVRPGIVSVQPTQAAIRKRDVVIRALLNAILYLNSEDTEIKRAVGLSNPNLSHSKTRELRKTQESEGLLNYCALPVTFLNYHYARKYSVDSTTVSGHFRWQRCGAGYSKVKLIWIDEHVRNYSAAKEVHDRPSNSGEVQHATPSETP